MAIVYRHRDYLNKIFYIGIGKSHKRAYDYYHRSKFWKRYAKKYGVTTEVVASSIPMEDAKELEMLLISEYGRRDLGTGNLVNLTDGGDGSFNHYPSNATKRKMSNSQKGKTYNKETRQKISKARMGKGNGMFGKKAHNSIQVYCGYLDEKFKSITSCAKKLGIAQSHLSNMINGGKENIYNVSKI